jgi:hypothetical protein
MCFGTRSEKGSTGNNANIEAKEQPEEVDIPDVSLAMAPFLSVGGHA